MSTLLNYDNLRLAYNDYDDEEVSWMRGYSHTQRLFIDDDIVKVNYEHIYEVLSF